jgi:hypothetical protein
MLGLHYTIVYRKGAENTAADALSRRPHQQATLSAISSVQPTWIDDIIDGYQHDDNTKKLLARLALNLDGVDGYSQGGCDS